jgi:dihydroorotase
MKKTLIKNGEVYSSDSNKKADILIEDGIIIKIDEKIEDSHADIIDARGMMVMPGVIDPQVHFREPGFTYKEDLRSGSMAAAAGGVTSFLEMPNTNPLTTSVAAMDAKKEIAAERCVVNYNFFIGATADNIEELNASKNVAGIKIFMGASTGDLLVSEEEDLDHIFKHANKLIAVHAENDDMVKANIKKYVGSENFDDHRKIRSVEAAVKATKMALSLSDKYNKRLHILHLTTVDEVSILKDYVDNPLVSSEVCPQHMLLTAPEAYQTLGAYAQMNPPIRTARHANGLLKGLKAGIIDCIATDHAPHTKEEKSKSFGFAPSGMPGVQTSLPLLLTMAFVGEFTYNDVVKWMCEKPAELYNIKNKGYLREGYDADIAIVAKDEQWVLREEDLFYKCGWSPYTGKELFGRVKMTLVNGDIVFQNGRIDEAVRGKEIQMGE